MVFPLALLTPPVTKLLPFVILVIGALGLITGGLLAWAFIATVATLLWWMVVYVQANESPIYALLFPLGALVLLYLFARAIIRGRHVSWKTAATSLVNKSVVAPGWF